jgi:hypothetical protein
MYCDGARIAAEHGLMFYETYETFARAKAHTIASLTKKLTTECTKNAEDYLAKTVPHSGHATPPAYSPQRHTEPIPKTADLAPWRDSGSPGWGSGL